MKATTETRRARREGRAYPQITQLAQIQRDNLRDLRNLRMNLPLPTIEREEIAVLGEAKALELIEQAIRHTGAEQAEATLTTYTSQLTRFAGR